MSTDSDVSPLKRRALDAWRALRAEQELALAALEESYRQRRQERAIERVREVTGAAAGMIGEEEPDTWNTPGGIVVPVAVEGLILRVVFPTHGLERVELEHYCEECGKEDHRGRNLISLADLGQELDTLDPLCMACRNEPAEPEPATGMAEPDPFPIALTAGKWEHVTLEDDEGVGVVVPLRLAEVARALDSWR